MLMILLGVVPEWEGQARCGEPVMEEPVGVSRGQGTHKALKTFGPNPNPNPVLTKTVTAID